MKGTVSEFQLHIWLIFPATALELSSGHKAVCDTGHQQPDASGVLKTSCFWQVLYNLPSVLLLNSNGRKWLRPERPENYLLWLCDQPFSPNMFWHNFGEPMLCLWALMPPSPFCRAMDPEMHLAIFLRGICATEMYNLVFPWGKRWSLAAGQSEHPSSCWQILLGVLPQELREHLMNQIFKESN